MDPFKPTSQAAASSVIACFAPVAKLTKGDVLPVLDAPLPVKGVERAAVSEPTEVNVTDATTKRVTALAAVEVTSPASLAVFVAGTVAVSVAAIEACVATDMLAGELLSQATLDADVTGVCALTEVR